MAGVLAAGLLATACGSTVAQTDAARSPVGAPDGLYGSGTTADGLGGAVSAGPPGITGSEPSSTGYDAAAGSLSGVVGGGTGTSGSDGTAAATSPDRTQNAQEPSAAAAATATTIRVGITYTTGSEAYYAKFGYASPGAGNDPKQEWEIVIDHINKNGGIGGRQIKPVWHERDANSTESFAVQDEKACAYYAQDKKVPVVFQGGGEGWQQCLRKNSIVGISPGSFTLSLSANYQKYRNYFEPDVMTFDRIARNVVDGLFEQGFYPPTSKVGLITYDSPPYSTAADVLEQQLKARGRKLHTKYLMATPRDAQGAGQLSADLSSAALRFRTEGIDRVQFLDLSGLMGVLFMNQAESQGYRPRYGFNSQDYPSQQAIYAPKAQLKDSLVVGWQPSRDTGKHDEIAAARFCHELMRKGRLAKPDVGGVQQCDSLFLFQRAITAQTPITMTGMIAALEGVGDAFRQGSGLTWETHFDTAQHDGADGIRYLKFNDGCTCFTYTTAVKPAFH